MPIGMKLFGRLALISLLLTACGAPVVPPPADAIGAPTAISVPVATQPAAATQAVAETGNQPAALATSRGDQLVASDPASVKYGAGRPVLIEFFRFT